MKISWFSDRGFVIHKIRSQGSICNWSAWYDNRGLLQDSEGFTLAGKVVGLARGRLVIGHLRLVGSVWRDMSLYKTTYVRVYTLDGIKPGCAFVPLDDAYDRVRVVLVDEMLLPVGNGFDVYRGVFEMKIEEGEPIYTF
jgi:hypothetical protein